jgi:hypothetical protein
MMRAGASVVLGYVVMFVVVFATFTLAYLVLGPEGSFQPGSYEVSGAWIIVSIVLSIAAAVLGGLACAVVAKSPTPPKVLAGIVLVLGLIMAVPVLTQSDVEQKARSGEVGNLEAMQNAAQPGWIALLNPVLGAVGVLVGAGLKRRGGGNVA